jgi:hypothetical protein
LRSSFSGPFTPWPFTRYPCGRITISLSLSLSSFDYSLATLRLYHHISPLSDVLLALAPPAAASPPYLSNSSYDLSSLPLRTHYQLLAVLSRHEPEPYHGEEWSAETRPLQEAYSHLQNQLLSFPQSHMQIVLPIFEADKEVVSQKGLASQSRQ